MSMMAQHYEHDVHRRFRGDLPPDALHETLFELQLVTQALMDGHYYEAAEMLGLANSDSAEMGQIRAVIRNLKVLFGKLGIGFTIGILAICVVLAEMSEG